MGEDDRTALSDITRAMWIGYHWIDQTDMGDDDRMFKRSFRRAPDEAAQAADDWDSTAEERGFSGTNEG